MTVLSPIDPVALAPLTDTSAFASTVTAPTPDVVDTPDIVIRFGIYADRTHNPLSIRPIVVAYAAALTTTEPTEAVPDTPVTAFAKLAEPAKLAIPI